MTSTPADDRLLTPRVKAVLGFTIAYLGAAVIAALAMGNGEFIIYIIQCSEHHTPI